jgi:hemolysin activation/secretion protein
MKRSQAVVLGGIFMLLTIMASDSLAQSATSQTSGSVLREHLDQQKDQDMERGIRTEKKAVVSEAKPAAEGEAQGRKLEVKEIKIEGNTLLKDEELFKVKVVYENRMLDMDAIRQLTAEITGLYRSKGFITSRAILPPQTIENGVLIIRIIEGKFGELTVTGNKYFSSSLLRSKVEMKKGDSFDYPDFLRSLEFINEHPDRTVKANLVPGKEPGMTDVVLEVKERRPYHVGFEFDNWVAKEMGRYRYSLILQHNNLTGHDDRLLLSALASDNTNLRLQQGQYTFPLSNTMSVGATFLRTRTEPGRQFESLDIRGKGDIYGVFTTKEFIHKDDLQMRGNLAFDFEDIKESSLGQMTSHDKLRVLRMGMEWDFLDHFGRNIVNYEIDQGIPNFMGSMDAKDAMASRVGGGGKFTKGVFSYYRLQPMPWETHILWKNNAQFTNHSLVAAEQFQIGGPASVRAYAPGEYSGDNGYYSAVEWSVPVYFLSKKYTVPFRNVTLYDALRLVAFYDYGVVNSNRTTDGQEKSHVLRGYGAGIRLNPDKDLAIRIETGFPQGDKSSDGSSAHTWFEVQYQY